MGDEPKRQIYDLEERTRRFGEDAIRFARKIPRGPLTDRLIGQFVGAATSVGANYCEADDAESGQDFAHKIGIAKKESRESIHFLRMIAVAVPSLADDAQPLIKEARELNLIFNTIYRKVKRR